VGETELSDYIRKKQKTCSKFRKTKMKENITEQAFKRAVEQRIKDRNISFILAVYQIYDEFLKQEIQESGIKLACKKGCCLCCYHLINCTEMEIDEVIRYIKNLPKLKRRPLVLRLRSFAKKWQKYYQRNESILSQNPFQAVNDWRGKPCPFLNKKTKSCDIYPVRIMDCRTVTSVIPCTRVPGDKFVRFRFRTESLTNNLILDRQKEIGPYAVTPVHHWLVVKKL